MSSGDLMTFWATVAQLAVVLGLALVLEARHIFSGGGRTDGWRGWVNLVVFLLVAAGIVFAVFTSLTALLFGSKYADWAAPWMIPVLVVSLSTVLLTPILLAFDARVRTTGTEAESLLVQL